MMSLMLGSSRISGSTKNATGISTSSRGPSFCSSKQKHWTLLKYAPALNIRCILRCEGKLLEKLILASYLLWSYIVRCYARDCFIRIVLCPVERQGDLTRNDFNLSLCWSKRPRHTSTTFVKSIWRLEPNIRIERDDKWGLVGFQSVWR